MNRQNANFIVNLVLDKREEGSSVEEIEELLMEESK